MSQRALADPFALVGAVLQNEYRVDAVVGEGGFGVVYRGLHLGLEQPIAIKVLKGLELEDRRMQDTLFAKFKDEAKLLYTLSQQSLNIVRSMDFGALTTPTGAWAPFMVLEWLEGRSLADDLGDRRQRGMRGRSLDEALAILEPAASGFAVAHQRRVAHRDIKPANLFLLSAADGPRVKVLDFGIAKMMKEGEQAGTKGTFASFTWMYAAPEQLDPRLGTTGLQTDVYGFALVLTELLTDRFPSDGMDVVSILKAATDPTVRPTPRTRGAQNIPDAVEVACRRALAVDPNARFPTIPDFWAAITSATAGRRSITAAVPASAIPPRPSHAQAAFAATAAAPSAASSGPYPQAPAHVPTAPPMPMHPSMHHAPMQPSPPPWTGPPTGPPLGTAPPGHAPHTGTHRRPLPPRPAETSSVVPVTIVLFVLALLLAGSCAALHLAC